MILNKYDILQKRLNSIIENVSSNWEYIGTREINDIHEHQLFKCKTCGEISKFELFSLQQKIPFCSNCFKKKEKHQDDEIKRLIAGRGEMISKNGTLKIKCNDCGNIFSISLERLQRHGWCPQCELKERQKDKQKRAKFFIEQQGFEYVNSSEKCYTHRLKCNNGHIFHISNKDIENNETIHCKQCDVLKRNEEKCQALAKRLNLAFLGFENNDKSKAIWKCKNNHIIVKDFFNLHDNKVNCEQCEKERLLNEKQQLIDSFSSEKWKIVSYDLYTNSIKDINAVTLCCKTCGHTKTISFTSLKKYRDKKCAQCIRNKDKEKLKYTREISQQEKDVLMKKIKAACLEKGELLSDNFRNEKDFITIKCKCGNVFETKIKSVLSGSWGCKYCYSKHIYISRDEFEKVAEKQNLVIKQDFDQCTPNEKIELECKKHNHVFSASFNKLNRSIICKSCKEENAKQASRKLAHSFEECQELALKLNMTYIQPQFVFEPEIWKCNTCGKEYATSYFKMKKRNGCSICRKTRETKLLYHSLEKDKNITLISDIPRNRCIQATWKCNTCNHEFKASYYYVFDNGCKNCKNESSLKHSNELFCKHFLEKTLNIGFVKARPSFLKYMQYNLELDMFSEQHHLAFEYQGQQHYYFVDYFHKTKDRFLASFNRDVWKAEQCKLNDILLIQIQYFECNDTIEQKEKKLLQLLEDYKVFDWINKYKEDH